MKKILIAVIILAAAVLTAFVMKGPLNIKPLELGAKAPMTDYALQDPAGSASQSLNDLKGENGLLVVFSCNTCPFVVAWEDRYNELASTAKANGIGMVLVNSNEAFRGDADAPEQMVAHAKEQGYTMPYLIDQKHQLADAFGARTTPHVYLFDSDFTLVYRGAIDDNRKGDEVKETYALDALEAVGSGEAVPTPTSKAIGCSIKRVKS